MEYCLPPEMDLVYLDNVNGTAFNPLPLYDVYWNNENEATIFVVPNNEAAVSYNYTARFNEEVQVPNFVELQQLIEWLTRYFRDEPMYSLDVEVPC